MNKLEEKNQGGGTLGFKTGYSERSAVDLFSKIEVDFLEKYFLNVLNDEIGQNILMAFENDP